MLLLSGWQKPVIIRRTGILPDATEGKHHEESQGTDDRPRLCTGRNRRRADGLLGRRRLTTDPPPVAGARSGHRPAPCRGTLNSRTYTSPRGWFLLIPMLVKLVLTLTKMLS